MTLTLEQYIAGRAGNAAGLAISNNEPGKYTYSYNGTGGVNYFLDGIPVTNKQYGTFTGRDTDAIEKAAADNYNTTYIPPTTYTPSIDPYAQWGGAAAFNRLVSGFNNQKQGIISSASDAANNVGNTLKWNVFDTIDNLTHKQRDINNKNVQNEASRLQGRRDIMDMVGRGIKSTGIMLGNRNAGSSSAAQEIADAYSKLGQRQMTSVGNQYAKNAADIDVSQGDLNLELQQGPQRFRDQINQNVNNIVAEASTKLYALDAAMANASMPERIAIEQEKANIRNSALAALQQYDTQMSSGLGGIKAADRATNIAKANEQLLAGTADPNLFNYITQMPANIQNTGPMASELPIYTYNKNKRYT